MQIRVYDQAKGDFILELPDKVEITYGYFNPVTGQSANNRGYQGHGADTMRTSALRIYSKVGNKKLQIACFLGVDGYRDMSIKLKRVVEHVTVTTNLDDDGDGAVNITHNQRKQARLALEPGYRADGEDIPF